MAAHDKDQWFDPPPAGSPEADGAPGGTSDTFESSVDDDVDAEVLDEEAAALAASADLTEASTVPTAEAAEYRDALLRVKADFDNYRKRVAKDQASTVQRAAEKLVSDLLPVLDACEAALGHGASDVEPIYKSLLDVLEKGGLTRMAAEGQPFDPNLHEAVLHEAGDGGETIVLESLRTGYLWNGRVVRPAMVKVRG